MLKVNDVIKLLAEEKSVKDISLNVGVAKSTIYRWKSKYREEIVLYKENIRKQNMKKVLYMISNAITKLIELGKFDEALKLCCDDMYKNSLVIMSQRITVLIKLGRLEEALSLCCEEICREYLPIISQRITILMKLGRLEEALNLCNNYEDNKIIREKKKKVLNTLNNVGVIDLNCLDEWVSDENIENLDVCAPCKVILRVAFYEKKKYPTNFIAKYLKEQSIMYSDDALMLRIVKKLLNRFKMKNKLFDMNFYRGLLEDMAISLDNEKRLSLERKIGD